MQTAGELQEDLLSYACILKSPHWLLIFIIDGQTQREALVCFFNFIIYTDTESILFLTQKGGTFIFERGELHKVFVNQQF